MKIQIIQKALRVGTSLEGDYSFNDAYNLATFGVCKADILKVRSAVFRLYGFDKSRLKLTEIKKELDRIETL